LIYTIAEKCGKVWIPRSILKDDLCKLLLDKGKTHEEIQNILAQIDHYSSFIKITEDLQVC